MKSAAPQTEARANARTFTASTMTGMIREKAPPKLAPAATQHAKPPVTGKRKRSADDIFPRSAYIWRRRASSGSDSDDADPPGGYPPNAARDSGDSGDARSS